MYIDAYILTPTYVYIEPAIVAISLSYIHTYIHTYIERWGARVETPKNVRGEIGGWGRVPFNEPYAPSLNTIYDGA